MHKERVQVVLLFLKSICVFICFIYSIFSSLAERSVYTDTQRRNNLSTAERQTDAESVYAAVHERVFDEECGRCDSHALETLRHGHAALSWHRVSNYASRNDQRH